MVLRRRPQERGSAILILFIAVALFGALAFAFSHGSRSSVTMLQGVQNDAASTSTQDCTNTVNLAVKRLELRGCGNKISYLADGSNANADAPTDGSCSVFHPNGGGAKACNASAIVGCQLSTLAIGQTCGNAIYAGIANGRRIYTTDSDLPGVYPYTNGTDWANCAAFSDTDGAANTDLLLSPSCAGYGAPYKAAEACRAIGPEWYLPVANEIQEIHNNKDTGDLAGTFPTSGAAGGRWTSRNWNGVRVVLVWGGTTPWLEYATDSFHVRCVRRD